MMQKPWRSAARHQITLRAKALIVSLKLSNGFLECQQLNVIEIWVQLSLNLDVPSDGIAHTRKQIEQSSNKPGLTRRNLNFARRWQRLVGLCNLAFEAGRHSRSPTPRHL